MDTRGRRKLIYWKPIIPWIVPTKLTVYQQPFSSWFCRTAIWNGFSRSVFWSMPTSADCCACCIISQLHLGFSPHGLSSSSRIAQVCSYNGKVLEQQASSCRHFWVLFHVSQLYFGSHLLKVELGVYKPGQGNIERWGGAKCVLNLMKINLPGLAMASKAPVFSECLSSHKG